MKKSRLSKSLFALTLTLLLLGACRNDEDGRPQLRRIQFKVTSEEIVTRGGRVASFEPDALLVSIEKANSEAVYTMEQVEIFQLEDGYISVPLELPAGEYKLTLFALIDSEDNIIAATPMENSPMAEYVDDALPIEFTVTRDETTFLNPQVLVIEEGMDIGYGQFGIEVVKLLPISVSVFDHETLVSADITIEGTKNSEVAWTKQTSLSVDENDLFVKSGMDAYKFTITKEGYYPLVQAIFPDDLKNNPDRSFYLTKIEPQLKSIVSKVYCCPGSGFVPTKIDFTYNTSHMLSKTTHSYQSGGAWYQSYYVLRSYNPNAYTPFKVRYNFTGGTYTEFQNTLSSDVITSMATLNTASGSLGNYSISLTHDPATGLLTSAIIHDNDYNSNLNYSYVYNSDGDLISFEARYGNELLYAGQFSYDSYNNIYPSHMLGDWIQNMMNMGYENLLHLPFTVSKPKHNIISYQLSMYASGGLYSKETVTMDYTYDVNGLPASLNATNTVEVTGYAPIVIERQKETVFQYQ